MISLQFGASEKCPKRTEVIMPRQIFHRSLEEQLKGDLANHSYSVKHTRLKVTLGTAMAHGIDCVGHLEAVS